MNGCSMFTTARTAANMYLCYNVDIFGVNKGKYFLRYIKWTESVYSDDVIVVYAYNDVPDTS